MEPVHSILRRCRPAVRWLVLAVFVVGLLALAARPPEASSEPALKDFALQGIVDCAQRSGQRCAIGDTLAVWTSDIGSVLQRVVIDVTWMKRQINQRRLDQDDLVCIEVRERPDGLLQGLGFVEPCEGLDGSINPGLSDGQREFPEQPKPPQLDPDQQSPIDATATATPTNTATRRRPTRRPPTHARRRRPPATHATETPTPTNTATATPTVTNTATATGTATATATRDRYRDADPDQHGDRDANVTNTATATATFTITPTATATITPTATPTFVGGVPPVVCPGSRPFPQARFLPARLVMTTSAAAAAMT